MFIKQLQFRGQVRLFVLFLVGRVGSTYLTSVLNSHPEIVALGEELRDLEAQGSDAQLRWAESFLMPPLVGRHQARGFNVKLTHIVDPKQFATLLREKRCYIFHMQRRNRVKAVVSRINGQRLFDKTGMWGLFDDDNRLPPTVIDPTQFDELLKQREKVDQELADYVSHLSLPTLPLYYEDMLLDEQAFLKQVLAFLEVPFQPMHGVTLKITNDALNQAIINFDEIRAKYVGTPYETMFDEVNA
jgi:hypothetical protein